MLNNYYYSFERLTQALANVLSKVNTKYPEAALNFPTGELSIGTWQYLHTDNPKYRQKFSIIYNEIKTANGTSIPFFVIHCHKDGTNISSWIDLSGGNNTIVRPSSIIPIVNTEPLHTCPTCGKTQDKPDQCYYCRIHEQYRKAAGTMFQRLTRPFLGNRLGHPYLDRKGIPSKIAESLGCRVSGDALIIPLTGCEGYQVIYGDGQKRYAVKDGKRDAHVIVGEFDASEIYICEGVATAVSVYLATGKTVVAALDLNGLEQTTERLRNEYPQAVITLLADNDVKEGSSKNAGVDAANRAAQTFDCFIAVPEGEGKCDFNDIYLQHGAAEVDRQVSAALPPTDAEPPTEWAAVAPIRWLTRLFPFFVSFFAGWYYREIKKWELVAGKYLPQDLLKPYLKKNEQTVISVRSPMGSGKTRAILKEALTYAHENGLTFGYAAPLQNLVRNACTELGIAAHVDFDELDKLKNKPLLGFCVNGFTNKSWQPDRDTEYYDVLILDEVEQQLEAIVTGTVKDKIAVFNKLKEAIKRAKVTIILDADLRPETVKRLTDGYGGKVIIVDNLHKNWADREIIQTDDTDLIHKANVTLLNNERALIACASKKKARAIYKKLSKNHQGKKIWLLTQETAKEYRDFIKNPNLILEFEQPDAVIYTSVIGSGFSLDVKGYFDTCLLFGGRNLTVNGLYQLMGRYRHWTQFYCSVPEVGHHKAGATREDYRRQVIELAKKEKGRYQYLDVSKFEIDETNPFYDLYADVKFWQNESRANLRMNFEAKAKQLGATVERCTPSSKQEQKEILEQLRAAEAEYRQEVSEKVIKLHRENPMTDEEATKYTDSRIERSGDDYYRFIAYQYEKFYCEPVTVEGLLRDDGGRLQELIKAHERTLLNRAAVERLGKENLEEAVIADGTIDATQVKGIVVHHSLTRGVLGALGAVIDDEGLLDVSKVGKISGQSLRENEQLMTFIGENRDAINVSRLGYTVTDKTFEQPLKFVCCVLRSIGIELITRKNGNKRYKVIDIEKLESLNQTIKRRRAALSPEDKRQLSDDMAQIEYSETIDGTIYGFDKQGRGIIIGHTDEIPDNPPEIT